MLYEQGYRDGYEHAKRIENHLAIEKAAEWIKANAEKYIKSENENSEAVILSEKMAADFMRDMGTQTT